MHHPVANNPEVHLSPELVDVTFDEMTADFDSTPDFNFENAEQPRLAIELPLPVTPRPNQMPAINPGTQRLKLNGGEDMSAEPTLGEVKKSKKSTAKTLGSRAVRNAKR